MSLNAIPTEVKQAVIVSQKFELHSFHPTSGGCINNGGGLQTSRGKYFLKWNQAAKLPLMFEAEQRGLQLLQSTGNVTVPVVIDSGSSTSYQFILMEWIEQYKATSLYWETLGRQLASLHQNTSSQFGLDHNNYIGSLPQYNNRCDTWSEFFIANRLEPQIRLLHVDAGQTKVVDRFFKNLSELIPEEKPVLLHGDLWSGNILAGETGAPVLIDPAVYYGHREAEMAFTRLFGGFGNRFYDAYQEAFPLFQDHAKRVEIFNIYPLLVHANLFGGSYLSQAFGIIERWA